VHGDLSEYNLLWHNNQVYVIDVSQSVESDHPSALDFLRKDASNINDFFRKVGRLSVMNVRQLFEFVTTPLASEAEEMDTLDRVMAEVNSTTEGRDQLTETSRREIQQQEQVDEAVFMSSFLPRSLNQVADHEIDKIEAGDVEDSYAHAVATLISKPIPRMDEHGQVLRLRESRTSGVDNAMDEDSEGSEETDSDDEGFVKVAKTQEELAVARAELKNHRKANKKAVKEENSDRRKTKLKKKDKQRAIKKAKAGNRNKK
jgi:RIO kinase 1